ncbi:peptidylprolyl isomerase [Rhodobacter sphaeroides]|uniref:Parvulin-like PPIase n=2 Tax=Cereibacter sphaeroides TaxID=1063 RepID=Q3J4X9_CERS4|nr:peptidyl-prolyl cis-trans isomerase [Cereibacter sphaeroides]AAD09115.1 YbaU [Cereibacter sphaeroides]ABA78155.1 putative peptidyl-prolyl cis-trans isomerase [Cereibacter sphaeroides 2.4.1]AMJ46525.1 peptidylprolyl isomerase [Cereibacter sphaeroides]ANS33237.1 peptidylprolyl isomerase [Cereibacter sphaeroides]ATN62282.1 peptidylprolyl isomerase [Cereibacter sphaeroides]
MSKLTSIEHHKPKKKGTQLVFWGLVGLMAVGLGGFGVTNFGGGLSTVGSVGDRDITTGAYARALQQEMRALGAQINQPVTMEMAKAFGLDQQVRRRLVTEAALSNEADRIGLSVGDARVAREITGTDAFHGPSGQFDRETYRLVLRQNNLSEGEFETGLREDMARSLLQGAVGGGFIAPAQMVNTLHAYIAERRSFGLLRVTEANLAKPLAAPTDAELQAWYEAHPADFTAPETKRITYAALLPQDVAATLPADEAALRRLYDERHAEFVQPERRLVERLVFPTAEAAAEARKRLDAGTPFETLVSERGLELADIDLGDASRDALGGAADAVFALTEPGIAGPVETDLGPALFRVNGVIAAHETPFEEVRDDLLTEYQQEAAGRAIAGRREQIDDLLAAGATLEDLAGEAGMEIATVDYAPGLDSDIAGYEAFRTAADKLQKDDFPETILLNDGGLLAMRLDEVVAPKLKPFEEVRDDVAEAARKDALTKALAARATEIAKAAEEGTDLGSFGPVEDLGPMTRDGFVEGVPETLVPAAFEMQQGAFRAIEGADFAGVLRLDAVEPAAADDEAARALKASLSAQIEQALSQDALALFSNSLMQEAGITLNDAAISAVQAQFQ